MDLIQPKKDVIDQFNRFWAPENNEWEVQLSTDPEVNVDIRDLGIDFNEICQGEKVLDDAFRKLDKSNPDNTLIAVLLLDSIYHTRLKDPIRVAQSIHNEIISKEGTDRIICDSKKEILCKNVDQIAKIDKEAGGAYIYSFATKFCNRLAPDKYPIFDSFAAGLLMFYLKDIKKSGLGNYETYITKYNRFKEQYELKDLSYKIIDIFMWTYGKALHNWLRENDNPNIKSSPYYRGGDISYVSYRTDS